MSLNARTQGPEEVAVATSVLKVFGASSWTGEDPNLDSDRMFELTNCGTTELYVHIDADPSSSSYKKVLYEGDVKSFLVRAGEELRAVRASGSGNVVAQVRLY